MKTISLSDVAYQRLMSWKNGNTFSELIEKMIPPKGTLQAAIQAAQSLPALSEDDFKALEEAVNVTRKQLPPAWN